MEDIVLLKAGRHLRPTPRFKVIIGRDETENHFLAGIHGANPGGAVECQGRWALHAVDLAGPLLLVEGHPTEEDLTLACRLTARFGQGRQLESVRVEIEGNGRREIRQVAPLPPDEIPAEWYL